VLADNFSLILSQYRTLQSHIRTSNATNRRNTNNSSLNHDDQRIVSTANSDKSTATTSNIGQ